MNVAIEAGWLGNGGRAILNELLRTLAGRPDVDEVVVFGKADVPGIEYRPSPRGRTHALRWAVSGWAQQASSFDRALSFTGFAQSPGQTVLVHNALYYDPAAQDLPLDMQLRLAVLRELTNDSVGSARKVVVQSEFMRRAVLAHHGVGARVICTIPAPSQTAGKTFESDLLWVGTEIPFKDFETAIKAATRLKRRLTLVGNPVPMANGPYHQWLGDIPRSQVFELYRNANVLVMTSRAESLGLPLAEAMQSGLPVVAPELEYACELCGDAAAYYRAGNVDQLCTAVETVETYKDMHLKRGYEKAARWASDSPFEQFADLILDS